MKLTKQELLNRKQFIDAGFKVPTYDFLASDKLAIETPRWLHFGIGNIFRVFIASIADDLLESGDLDRGLTCIETFDDEVVDKIYRKFDNLGLSVILHSDGTRTNRILASMSEAVKVSEQYERLKCIFESKDLQLASFTITEKGYALKDSAGKYFSYVLNDLENGPSKCSSAMTILTAVLAHRFNNGAYPIALVSMDNCSKNGLNLEKAVLEVANYWLNKGYVKQEFIDYLNSKQVSFPWTMIDKITPRPSKEVMDDLANRGLQDMVAIETSKRTYIAPFVNAEYPQYLVIEDDFPNGRPDLSKGQGVYLADRDTVNKAERMKVTALLNPVHSGTSPLGVVLGIEGFAKMLNSEPSIMKLAKMIAYDEGMPVIESPGILSPEAFVDELFLDRFPNEYLGDTNLRICTDESQGLGVRFGETIKSYLRIYGNCDKLKAIPLGIAGWCRYMLGIDDFGNKYVLAPDPMNEEVTELYKTIVFGKPETVSDQLKPILSNKNVFFVDLYEAGIGERIEQIFKEMIAGVGSTRKTIEKYMM